MSRLRSKSTRNWAACVAILGMLFQAGLSAWHATAMFDLAAGHGDGQVQAAMMCHKAMGIQTGDHNGKPPSQQNCTCCLGMIAVAAELAAVEDLQTPPTAEASLPAMHHAVSGGRPLLAPESRGPPLLV